MELSQISDSEYEEIDDEELLISKYHQQKIRKTIILENHPIQTLAKQNKKLAPKLHSVIDNSLLVVLIVQKLHRYKLCTLLCQSFKLLALTSKI